MLWFEDDGEIFGVVGKSGFEANFGFLERFLGIGDDLFYLTNDQIAGNEGGWLGEDVVTGAYRGEAGNVGDFGGGVLEFVKAFLSG